MLNQNQFLAPSAAVKQLRSERMMSQLELSRLAGISAAQLCKIERGRNDMTASTLRRLAAALDVPVSAILECGAERNAERPSRPRSSGGAPFRDGVAGFRYTPIRSPCAESGKIAASLEDIEKRTAAQEERLGINGQSTLHLAYSYGDDGRSAEILARDMRVSLGMGTQPTRDIAGALESRNVLVVHMSLPASAKSASFYNSGRKTLLIALNSSNTPERNAYQLAYELGAAAHFAANGWNTFADEGSVHLFLRAFAAAFLMPEEAVRGAVARLGVKPGGWTMPVLVYAKERFGVSAEAFALRLESLGLIAPSLRHKLRDELRARYTAHPRSMEPHPPKNQTRLDVLGAVAEANGGIKEKMAR